MNHGTSRCLHTGVSRPARATLCIQLFAAAALAAAGCAHSPTPTMTMRHEAAIGTRYPALGRVRVLPFEDRRPGKERDPHLAGHWGQDRNWGWETSPTPGEYVRRVIVDEARRTGIFTPDENGEFTLRGEILSMKASISNTPVAYVAMIFSFGGSWGGLALLPFEFPARNTSVHYRVFLSRRGVLVYSHEITTSVSERYWGMMALTRESVSGLSMETLDHCVTKSVRKLFEQLPRPPPDP